MIIYETTTYRLWESDVRALFPMRRKDKIRKIDVKTNNDGTPYSVDVTVDRPSRGRWFKKVETKK